MLELYGSYGETGGIWWNIVQNSMETSGSDWKLLVSYKAWARLTPTLTHVIMYVLMTSGAEDRAMSHYASDT